MLVPGDLLNRHRLGWEQASRFLEEVPQHLPVFYSLGNHERRYPVLPCWLEMVECSGVTLLDNTTVQFGDIALGGPELRFPQGDARPVAYWPSCPPWPGFGCCCAIIRNIMLPMCGLRH